jgi:beta-lactamase superfamily II metal-dependent hydrolase
MQPGGIVLNYKSSFAGACMKTFSSGRQSTALALAAMLAACASTQSPTGASPPAASAPAPAESFAGDDAYLDAWVLDVGQGLCVFIDCPDNERPLLIDCGSMSYGERNTSATISAWINGRAGSQRMAVAISHPHQDHLSVLPRITRSKTENIITVGGPASDYPDRIITWAGGQNRLRDFSGTEPHFDDSVLHCGADTQVDILTVNAADRNPPDNGNSLVIAITLGRTQIILPGDAEGSTEAAALGVLQDDEDDHLPAPQVALISSHHGSSEHESNDAAWLEGLQPNAIIFSANPDYRTYRHPRCEILDRAEPHVADASARSTLTCGTTTSAPTRRQSTDARMLSTYDNGTMRIRLTGSQITIACETMSGACRSQLGEAQLPGGAPTS